MAGGDGRSLADVKALLRTFDDGGNWTMTEQAPAKTSRAPKPAKPKTQQELF